MLNVWKNLFRGIFSEKRVLPQKVALETLSPVLTTLLTIFRHKSKFSTKFWKTPPTEPPPPLPPFWKKLSNWTFSQEQIFSRRSFSGQIKTQFWQSAFKAQKTSGECLEKVLKTMSQPKKDRLPKKNLQICRIQFWQSCWNFSKKVRNFAPKFYENRLLDFRKTLSNCLKFSR